MKRRDFLKVGATVGAGSLILNNCATSEQPLIPLLVSEDELAPGEDKWISSLCQQCSAGCGISVRVMQGEIVREVGGQPWRVKTLQAKKIEGNANHPLNHGKTCARGQAGLQVLYNPDRIQGPLKLSGQRGSGKYSPTTWTDALQILTSRLLELKATPDGLALLTGRRSRGSMGVLLERFARSFGTPHLYSYEPFDPAPIRRAFELTTGWTRLPIVDFENAHYLLSLGANLFETFLSPVRYNGAYDQMRQGRPGLRGKFVQAEPRLSLTAANADEWLPIRPGTEGLLALALCQVIVQESLYDRAFVAESTTGFAEWSKALGVYDPETVARQVDVPADTIVRVAREFAQRRPSVAVGDSRDPLALAAICGLNALVGNYGKSGGLLFDALPPEPAWTEAAPPSAGDLHELVTALIEDRSPVKALLIHETNPLFSLPEADRLEQALGKIPFIASFSSFMDETTAMADLILPNHVYLERWQDDVPEPGVGIPVRTLAQPVVEPVFDTRDTGDVLLEVARSLGGETAEALPWTDFASMVQDAFKPIQSLKRGSVVEEDFEAFWEKAMAQGGWWDPQYQSSLTFRNASRKFQFVMAEPLAKPMAYAGDERDFPFVLRLYPSLAFLDGRGANQPWLQEMPDPMTTVMWGAWVELNPQTAARLGIREGDVLSVHSMHGSIELPAYIYPGLRPEVISIPVGQGHRNYGRYATNRGANPLRLVGSAFDAAIGSVIQTETRVAVSSTGRNSPLVKFGSEERAHAEQELRR